MLTKQHFKNKESSFTNQNHILLCKHSA